MRANLRTASLVLLGVLGLFLILFGVLYISVAQMLPFHAAAVPVQARAAVLPLYHALMALIGGASIGLGFLGLFVTFGPMRTGAPGAAYATGAAYAIALVAAAIVAERLRAETGAPTSWHIMGGLLAIDAAALIAHRLGGRRQPA